MRPAGTTQEAPPTSTRVPRPALSVAAAGLALAAGAGLVSAAIAWTPPRSSPQALARGARLYAAECASCHGAGLEGEPARNPPGIAAPPPLLGAGGHAWQHSDAELKAIVARGIGAAAVPAGPLGMPAFARRLGGDEIDDILAYVKSRWPAGVSAYQATLNPNGGRVLATLLRNPTWRFPSQCLPPSAAMGGP